MTAAAAAGTLEREVSKIVSDLLGSELELDPEHCLLGNQAWDIPADKQLFVVVFDQAGPVLSTNAYLDTDETSASYLKEVQESTIVHDCRIEMMSFDNSARVRKEEPGMALASIAAQQSEGKYRVQIGRAQTPVDASETETTKRMQKFVIHVNITALHRKVKTPPAADYFDKFNGATEAGTAKGPKVTDQQ